MQHLQTSFFYDLQELIRNAPLLRKYYLIFRALDLSALQDRNYGVGATGCSRHAMLRAFIIKHLEGIKSVPQLIDYLNSIPPLLEMCGFELSNPPDESQFYRFLQNTKNSTLKQIHLKANQLLLKDGLVSLDEFILDSKPVMAATKENNLKNPNRNSKDKTRKPKRNPTATLSYYSWAYIPINSRPARSLPPKQQISVQLNIRHSVTENVMTAQNISMAPTITAQGVP